MPWEMKFKFIVDDKGQATILNQGAMPLENVLFCLNFVTMRTMQQIIKQKKDGIPAFQPRKFEDEVAKLT